MRALEPLARRPVSRLFAGWQRDLRRELERG
jgi:hypothetical protein